MDKTLLGLKIAEWLAIIGAFAWLPTIIQWIKEYFNKPKLTIISGSQAEIGFTLYGPIINLSMAFLSETKKAMVKKVELELIHENNDTQKFSWVWFEELLYSMDLPDFQQINTKRNQNAIVIKIGVDELIEKKVGFQQNTFKKEYDKHYKQLTEDAIEFYQLKKSPEELKITNSYRKIHDILTNSFNWKVGKYKVKIAAHISTDNIVTNHEFDFALNTLDIKLLHTNIENCHLNLAKTFIDNETEIRQWQWVNANKLINDL